MLPLLWIRAGDDDTIQPNPVPWQWNGSKTEASSNHDFARLVRDQLPYSRKICYRRIAICYDAVVVVVVVHGCGLLEVAVCCLLVVACWSLLYVAYSSSDVER